MMDNNRINYDQFLKRWNELDSRGLATIGNVDGMYGYYILKPTDSGVVSAVKISSPRSHKAWCLGGAHLVRAENINNIETISKKRAAHARGSEYPR